MYEIANPDVFRNNIRNMIHKIINNEKHSKNIEIGIYNKALEIAKNSNIVRRWDNSMFVQIYYDKLKTICYNLKNTSILNKINNKEIKPHEIAFMSHQEMSPERWSALIEKKKMIDENKYAPKLEASTDNFTCWKCKSKKCSYYQLQTRSADEPMTTFVTCLTCGNRWKC